MDGIGGHRIWDDVKGQSILGEGDFVNRLIDYARGCEEVKEILFYWEMMLQGNVCKRKCKCKS